MTLRGRDILGSSQNGVCPLQRDIQFSHTWVARISQLSSTAVRFCLSSFSCQLSARRSRTAAFLITINHVAPALHRISPLFMNIGAGAELPDRGSGCCCGCSAGNRKKKLCSSDPLFNNRWERPSQQLRRKRVSIFVFSDVQELMFDLTLLLVSVEFGSDCLIPLISQKWQLSGSELSFHISSSSLPWTCPNFQFPARIIDKVSEAHLKCDCGTNEEASEQPKVEAGQWEGSGTERRLEAGLECWQTGKGVTTDRSNYTGPGPGCQHCWGTLQCLQSTSLYSQYCPVVTKYHIAISGTNRWNFQIKLYCVLTNLTYEHLYTLTKTYPNKKFWAGDSVANRLKWKNNTNPVPFLYSPRPGVEGGVLLGRHGLPQLRSLGQELVHGVKGGGGAGLSAGQDGEPRRRQVSLYQVVRHSRVLPIPKAVNRTYITWKTRVKSKRYEPSSSGYSELGSSFDLHWENELKAH